MSFTAFVRSLLLSTLLFVPNILFASSENIYQGQILVADEDETQLQEKALAQVLVKVSGNTKIMQQSGSERLSKRTQSLLSQFGYTTLANQPFYQASFDAKKINQALMEMQQPIWGETRPDTLVWLVKRDNRGRKIVSDNMVGRQQDSELSLALQSIQRQRGISFQFPLMDLDDSVALTPSDISGAFYDQIAQASVRYRHNHFVAATLQQRADKSWSLNWSLVSTNKEKQTQRLAHGSESGEKQKVLLQLGNKVANYYASQYAVSQNEGDKLTQVLYIDAIDSVEKLMKLNNLLDNLLAISSYQVSKVRNQQVIVTVKVNGALQSFQNALLAQSKLQLSHELDDVLYMRWQ